jgi:hypothetical protein
MRDHAAAVDRAADANGAGDQVSVRFFNNFAKKITLKKNLREINCQLYEKNVFEEGWAQTLLP